MSNTFRREPTEDRRSARNARVTDRLRTEARDYYRLVEQAAARGVPVSLDDPRSPRTIRGLVEAMAA